MSNLTRRQVEEESKMPSTGRRIKPSPGLRIAKEVEVCGLKLQIGRLGSALCILVDNIILWSVGGNVEDEMAEQVALGWDRPALVERITKEKAALLSSVEHVQKELENQKAKALQCQDIITYLNNSTLPFDQTNIDNIRSGILTHRLLDNLLITIH